MAVVICPWCQSEIPQEEGAEPEQYCPVCENELGGYRTVTFGLDDPE
jgi:predicted amidophosphoribosyltransferase